MGGGVGQEKALAPFLEFYDDGCLRFRFENQKLAVRVVGDTDDPDPRVRLAVKAALDRISKLEENLRAQGVAFEVYRRKWWDGEAKTYRTDYIRIDLPTLLGIPSR